MNWADVERVLESSSPGVRMVLTKDKIIPPPDAGAQKSLGIPVGQSLDWRFPPRPDGAGLHVHEFPDRYEAHLDQIHPEVSTIKHLVFDLPKLFWATLSGIIVTWKILK